MRVVVAMGCLGVGSGSGDPGPEMGALGGCGGACGDAWWRPSRGVRANAPSMRKRSFPGWWPLLVVIALNGAQTR